MFGVWISSSTELPQEGQPIEFLLDHREVALDGIYDRRIFRSRWSGYDVDRVRTWRSQLTESAAISVGI